MQFDKVSLFYVAPDASIRVETIVSANGEQCRIDGQPMIEVDGETIQLGCIRITEAALFMLAHAVRAGAKGLIQAGDYKSADPNTRRPQCCDFHKTGGGETLSCGGDNGHDFNRKSAKALMDAARARRGGRK